MTPGIMVAMEGTCIAFLLVVLSAYTFLSRFRTLRKDWYFYSLVLTLVGLITDLIAWACELGPSNEILQFASNYLAMIVTCFIISTFGFYIIDLISEKNPVSVNIARAITAANIIGVIVPTVAAFRGTLFDVVSDPLNPGVSIYNGSGLAYIFPMVITMLSLILLFVLVIANSKYLGREKVAVFSIYFVIPMIGGALEMFCDEVQLTYASTAVALAIVFVLLQSSRMDELLLREEVLNEVSYEDHLTGLLNRRAYDRDVNSIKKDDAVNIAFCDLNGLKRVNDERGHSAGDEYLISFSNMVTRHFPHDSVYRISGDEFVVVARDMDKAAFDKRIESLRAEINENSGIAALGTISGTGDMIPGLIKEAEMAMYADKKSFYTRNPEYKRGKTAYMNS